jgi:alpha-ribazole phosphatase
VDDRLAERDFGVWEMQPWFDLLDEVRQQEGLSPLEMEHPELVAPPGGESTEAMMERVRSLVTEIRGHREWVRVACFCHGGVINMARLMVGDIEMGDLFIDVPHYGSVTSIDFDYLTPER